MKKIVLVLLISLFVCQGCSTVSGVGKDIQNLSDYGQRVLDKNSK